MEVQPHVTFIGTVRYFREADNASEIHFKLTKKIDNQSCRIKSIRQFMLLE
jgi:hypothetical protein